MISVLSAVAEIERENILVQTMEGRRQKAREGRWNGGFAPYGYQLVNGELIIAEDEAEIIRIIYDKFVNTTMGMAAIAAFLNNSGYKKKLRQNNTIEGFSTSFVKGVLDNPIYCGKLAFGRRKNEKIPGTRNEYHIVKQKDYLLSDGVHEAIISEEMWNQAHRKRQETGVLQVKTHSLEHEHILSGIIKCPVCGSGMYGNVNRKKHPDGGYYKDYFYYACKHRKLVDGHRCTYKRQWNEDRINAAVEEIIRKFVKNPKFEQEIRKQIGSSIDTSELDKEYDGLKDRLSQTTGAKNRLADRWIIYLYPIRIMTKNIMTCRNVWTSYMMKSLILRMPWKKSKQDYIISGRTKSQKIMFTSSFYSLISCMINLQIWKRRHF